MDGPRTVRHRMAHQYVKWACILPRPSMCTPADAPQDGPPGLEVVGAPKTHAPAASTKAGWEGGYVVTAPYAGTEHRGVTIKEQ